MYSLRTQPPPIRHPWLSGGLFEHRVQTLLILTEHQVLLSSKHMYISCIHIRIHDIHFICMICNRSFDSSLWRMISAALVSVVVYAVILLLMKNPYAQDAIEIIKKKGGKRKES